MPVQFEQNTNHHRKTKQGRPPLADERQWNTDDWNQAHGHSDIDQKVYKENTSQTIGIYPGKGIALPLGNYG